MLQRNCNASVACRGQVLMGAIVLVFSASLIAAGTVAYVMHEHRMSKHSAGWVESLHVAEAGVEDAINEFYKEASSEPAWEGWLEAGTNDAIKTLDYTDLDPDDSEVLRQYAVTVNTDTYQIASSSKVAVARFTNLMGRAVSIVLEPDYSSPFEAALLAKSYVKHAGNASVDSFDSTDPMKSTNGQFDALKRQTNGDIVTICTDPDSAVFATGSGILYGDIVAGIGGGVNISGNYTNLGAVGDGADVDISDVIVPMSTALTDPPVKIASAKSSQTILVNGEKDMAVSYVRMTGGTLTVQGSGRLRLYVEGDMSISGSASMIISNSPPSADLEIEIYANGDVLLNSFVNETGYAKNIGIFGTDMCTDVKYTGNSVFTGYMYTPHASYEFSGQGDFNGAVVANTIDVTGTGDFHYDESLGNLMLPFLLGYRIISWEELPAPF
jgi:hypothetical protein